MQRLLFNYPPEVKELLNKEDEGDRNKMTDVEESNLSARELARTAMTEFRNSDDYREEKLNRTPGSEKLLQQASLKSLYDMR